MDFLVYRSRALVAPGSVEAQAVVSASVRNNARNGLTGFLHHEPELFVQYLEGPEEAVRRTWQRLSSDSRHTDVEPIGTGPTVRRFFSGCRMGYSDDGVARLLDFLDEAAGKASIEEATAREAIWFLRGACQCQDLGIAC